MNNNRFNRYVKDVIKRVEIGTQIPYPTYKSDIVVCEMREKDGNTGLFVKYSDGKTEFTYGKCLDMLRKTLQ